MYLIFDTETTGLPKNFNAPLTDFDNWPRLVQLAWQIHDYNGKFHSSASFIIKPEGFNIPYNAEKIHGISTKRANKEGRKLNDVLQDFIQAINLVDFVVGHNISFDKNIVGCELLRNQIQDCIQAKDSIDTKEDATNFCKIPGGRGGKFKWPNLTELHEKLFNEPFDDAHDATADVAATARCFLELIRIEIIPFEKAGLDLKKFKNFQKLNPKPFESVISNIDRDKKSEDKELQLDEKEVSAIISQDKTQALPFSHLHVHSQYSVLQANGKIDEMIDKAVEYKMPAIGLSDHCNMFGAFKFVDKIISHPINEGLDISNLKLKPIIGCELNICSNHKDRSQQDNGSQQPFFALNRNGYSNLSKLSSLSYIDGFYYVPRVDKELILQYKEDLIVLSGSMYGSVPNLILNVGERQAEEEFKWWVDHFGSNFYVEINKHGLEEEDYVNNVLIDLAKKYDVKMIASNNVYYANQSDANSHDILLCVKDNKLQKTPIGKGAGYRYGFPNDQFYFKSSLEMNHLFQDMSECISNLQSLIDKVEPYKLSRDVLLPKFSIPSDFQKKNQSSIEGENAYLSYLTFEGAKKRYNEITNSLKERIDFELQVIQKSGYPGYFLIVQDFISQARKMNVAVGPGRGSAAGSVVAYCIGITNVDPLKYNLLFERFLNPDRVSLPDIDIDFDDEGRGRVIDWVVNKYGKEKVAQIITYGTMAAKSSIRDTARVLDLPLSEADTLAKSMPDGIKLSKLIKIDKKDLKDYVSSDNIVKAKNILQVAEGKDLPSQTINYASDIEGSIRNVGTHACGVIITPEKLIDLIPMTVSKDTDLLVTQFDNSVVDHAGLLKMDFLGLKNLTIIKDCVKIISKIHNKSIDIDAIPLDDQKTFDLFQKGETKGIFQFASDGMRSHLKDLKPDKFDDLIAMNALYRPGPMQYIPNYVARKHGVEKIEYDLPEMEEFLKDTYGITVYQEQVMQLSQKLAGFTRGEADSLRKAMGKKIKHIIDKLKPKFIDGCSNNGFDSSITEKIWNDWEKFAEYAFNKSHSTCYALIAYQTAYLKANYPAELMASLLTNHMRDIKDITLYMEEARRMNIKVLGPDVNESFYEFAVNTKGEVRFGLGAVKGVGKSAVETIVNERKQNGSYKGFDDFVQRVDLRSANKTTLESIAYSGGFDSFKIFRSQYFAIENDQTYIEKMIKFGKKVQDRKKSKQVDIFEGIAESQVQAPEPPSVPKWKPMTLLSHEKAVVGIYISGHPLDDYKIEIDNFCNANLAQLEDLEKIKNKELRFAAVVVDFEEKETKTGRKYGVLLVEDYYNVQRFFLFGEDYAKFKSHLNLDWILYIKGRVQKRYKSDRLEFKISSIEMLSEVMNANVRDAILQLDVSDLTEELMQDVLDLIDKNKGKHGLIVNLLDKKNKYDVNLLARKTKVDLTKDFFNKVKLLNKVNIKINS